MDLFLLGILASLPGAVVLTGFLFAGMFFLRTWSLRVLAVGYSAYLAGATVSSLFFLLAFPRPFLGWGFLVVTNGVYAAALASSLVQNFPPSRLDAP